MRWKEIDAVDQRALFVEEVLRKRKSLIECCEEFAVSRKTGYKWLSRYHQGGLSGLVDWSRRPHRSPHAVIEQVAELVVAARKAHPLWGPRKLRAWLIEHEPETSWPAPSTIGDLLKRRGLVGGRRQRPRVPQQTQPLAAATEPNVVWTADFKGCFRVAGRYCHPLTIADAYSRYLLRVHGLEQETSGPVQAVFESAFREFGLPLRIRNDNGSPFASRGPGGLSRLSVWWVRLGITPERIQPGHPEQNGRHERMHRTLKDATARPPRVSAEEQQRAFDRFRREFNDERPHEALGQRTPASGYTPSPRRFPEEVPDPEYPPEFEVRRIYPNSQVRWNFAKLMMSDVLANQAVGFEPVSDGRWQLWFGPIYLGLVIEEGRGKNTFIRCKPN